MKRAGDLIGKLFKNIDSSDLKIYGELFTSWQELAGTDISAHSRILELNRGVLYVGVDHPGWMQMISMQKGEILKKLKTGYSSLEIRDLRLMLIDGVPEEELQRRFSVDEIIGAAGTETASSSATEPAEETPPPEPPAEFKKKLEKLRLSINKKWK